MNMTEYSNLSNVELKLEKERLINEFNIKKKKLIEMCEDLEQVEKNYNKVLHEIEIRSNIL
jgi:hypothetical protein